MLKHPVASNCLGRFGTMYKHATFESRCSLGTPESTAEAKAGGSYFEWWFKCPRCKAIYLVEAARRFFDGPGTAEPSSAPEASPEWVARDQAILPWQ